MNEGGTFLSDAGCFIGTSGVTLTGTAEGGTPAWPDAALHWEVFHEHCPLFPSRMVVWNIRVTCPTTNLIFSVSKVHSPSPKLQVKVEMH